MTGRFHESAGWDEWGWLNAGRWEHNVKATLNGKRGQKILRELEAALVAMPVKGLIRGEVCRVEQQFDELNPGQLEPVVMACAIGQFALSKGDNPYMLASIGDWEELDYATAELGQRHGMTFTLAWLIGEVNDGFDYGSDEARWRSVLAWVRARLPGGA